MFNDLSAIYKNCVQSLWDLDDKKRKKKKKNKNQNTKNAFSAESGKANNSNILIQMKIAIASKLFQIPQRAKYKNVH